MWEHAKKQECEKNEQSTLSEWAQVVVLYCIFLLALRPTPRLASCPLPPTADKPSMCPKRGTLACLHLDCGKV